MATWEREKASRTSFELSLAPAPKRDRNAGCGAPRRWQSATNPWQRNRTRADCELFFAY
jgi:hypothetical protein